MLCRATVIEHRDVWYQDDGPLSKMLCEEQQESHDSQPEILDTCCACDEAKYEVALVISISLSYSPCYCERLLQEKSHFL